MACAQRSEFAGGMIRTALSCVCGGLQIIAMTFAASAQTRPSYLETPATVRVVGTLAPGVRVPLIVALPPTGASGDWLFTNLQSSIPLTGYVVLTLAGEPSRSDYAGFDRFTSWFDARLSLDLARVQSLFPIDPSRIYLLGFSLGGDLAWALLARHPNVYRGAFVMGSRCAATMPASALETLRARGARIVFAIGDHDIDARIRGLRTATERVRSAHIETMELRFDGTHELPTDRVELANALRMLFDAGAITPPAASASVRIGP